MGQEDVDLDNRVSGISRQLQQLTWSPLIVRGLAADCSALDCAGQLKLLLQAQALLTKNLLYQSLDSCLQRLPGCTPVVYGFLPRSVEAGSGGADEVVTAAQRDAAVTHLRFLNIFCNFRHDTFAHAVQLLDLVLGRVKVHPKFLSSVSSCCLYIAAKASEPPVLASSLHELLLLGQCGGSLADLLYTEQLIVELLGARVIESAASCSPLAFLRMFHDILLVDVADGGGCVPALDLSLLVSKLEVIVCQFDFTRFRADLLSLALLSYSVQQAFSDRLDLLPIPIAELQYYCQMNDGPFVECCEMIANWLSLYRQQPTRTPRLRLSWSVSRRTLHKMRPSTRAAQDLEPIIEDESLRTSFSNNDNDSSAFDSEVDDSMSADDGAVTCVSGIDDEATVVDAESSDT